MKNLGKDIKKIMRTASALVACFWLTNYAVAQTIDLENGLIAYYPFNRNAHDESGNRNHGRVSGATLTEDRNGVDSRAYKFDGNNDGVFLNNPDAFKLQNFTISAWVKPDKHRGPIIVNNPWLKAHGFVCSLTENGLSFTICRGGTQSNFGGIYDTTNLEDEALPLRQWSQVVFSYDGNKKIIYINGKRKIYDSSNLIITYDDSRVNIGYNHESVPQNNRQYFDGDLDDIRIYNRALSRAEVAGLYELESEPIAEKPTIEWNSPSSITYGVRIDTKQLNANTDISGEFIYDPPLGTLLEAGTHTLKTIFTPSDQKTYMAVDAQVTLVVKKLPVTIISEDKQKLYGQANPPLTVRYEGFINGENESVLLSKPTLSTTAETLSKPGVYPITIAGGTAWNYEITLKQGKMEVYEAEPEAPELTDVKVVRIGQKISFKFNFDRQPLRQYSIQRSLNLENWINDGPPIPALPIASIYRFSRTIDTETNQGLFYRVVVVE